MIIAITIIVKVQQHNVDDDDNSVTIRKLNTLGTGYKGHETHTYIARGLLFHCRSGQVHLEKETHATMPNKTTDINPQKTGIREVIAIFQTISDPPRLQGVK